MSGKGWNQFVYELAEEMTGTKAVLVARAKAAAVIDEAFQGFANIVFPGLKCEELEELRAVKFQHAKEAQYHYVLETDVKELNLFEQSSVPLVAVKLSEKEGTPLEQEEMQLAQQPTAGFHVVVWTNSEAEMNLLDQSQQIDLPVELLTEYQVATGFVVLDVVEAGTKVVEWLASTNKKKIIFLQMT